MRNVQEMFEQMIADARATGAPIVVDTEYAAPLQVGGKTFPPTTQLPGEDAIFDVAEATALQRLVEQDRRLKPPIRQAGHLWYYLRPELVNPSSERKHGT